MRATIVGAGGLGGPLALALGAAGIELAIVDPDRRRDLEPAPPDPVHRRSMSASRRRPCSPARSSRAAAGAKGYQLRWTTEDADDISGDSDSIVDGSDDPATKFAVADWAVATGRPYVIAAALRYGGNVLAGAPGHACYRCLFEEPVDAATCAGGRRARPRRRRDRRRRGGARDRPRARRSQRTPASIFVFDDLRRSQRAADRPLRAARGLSRVRDGGDAALDRRTR